MSADYDPTNLSPIVDGGEDDSFEVSLDSVAQVPAGTYPAKLTDLFKDVSGAGNDMWVWEFTIGEGPQIGKQLRVYTALNPNAAWKLAQVVRGLRLPMSGNTAKFSRAEAVGRWANIVVKMGSYQGEPRSEISNVNQWPADRTPPSVTF